jgi:hypothetical protein
MARILYKVAFSPESSDKIFLSDEEVRRALKLLASTFKIKLIQF